MIKLVRELFALLTLEQRKNFFLLQFLVVLMSFSEILGVASIAPFMALVSDMSILERENTISALYHYFSFLSPEQFVFWAGIGVLFTLSVSSIISMITTWKLSMFGTYVGTQIGDRLFKYYMSQPWLFHANSSSAQLVNQITTESSRVTNSIINPVLQINAKIVLAFVMSMGIFLYDPIIASSGLAIFFIAYILLYKLIRKKLYRDGIAISHESTIRYRLMNEGFGGIKDILLHGKQEIFINFFSKSGEIISKSAGANHALAQLPRYFIELIAFGSIVTLVLYLIHIHKGNSAYVFPILSVYALAGFKLLPAFQTVYSNIAKIKGGIAAYEAIKEDLKHSQEMTGYPANFNYSPLALQNTIELREISFTYPNKKSKALNHFSITIQTNTTVGIAGPSGSGKSTAIDILLGLIYPENGHLLIDNIAVDRNSIHRWQKNIGFVPQNIFLSEGSIAENIAFGIPKHEIIIEKVILALRLAHLEQFVRELPAGINTKVGERGIQLSGGQRQRIGIARALYDDPSVLIFDEATSALDGITEKIIIDAIHDFGGKKTIIMIAHRLKTIEKCDRIFFVDKGEVVDSGTYHELLEHNEHFKHMAKYA